MPTIEVTLQGSLRAFESDKDKYYQFVQDDPLATMTLTVNVANREASDIDITGYNRAKVTVIIEPDESSVTDRGQIQEG